MEADLIVAGVRLRWLCDGTDRLNWRDLWVLINQTGPGTAVYRLLAGDRAQWGDAEELLAGILDALVAGNWQRGGGKGPRPKQLPRPGVKAASSAAPVPSGDPFKADESGIFEAEPVPLSELNDWLGWT